MGIARARTVALLLSALLLGGTACTSRPANRVVVASVEVRGARQLDPAEILDRIATKASSTLLGFALQYEIYDRFVLERDIKRIERLYRARGFYDARVQASRVERLANGDVVVEVVVEEGEPIKVGRVVPRLVDGVLLEPEAGKAFEEVKSKALKEGDRFDEDRLASLKGDLRRALTDHGYARAQIDGDLADGDLLAPGEAPPPTPAPGASGASGAAGASGVAAPAASRRYSVRLDPVTHLADIMLKVEPGPLCLLGEVSIEGGAELPAERLQAALGIQRGDPYSTSRLEAARRALLELGVFSSVEYVADVDAKSSEIPVAFKVTPAPLRTVTFGGGLQADTLQTDVHFFAGYEHQNFLGGLRRLSMQVKPGLVLFPTNLQNLLPPERALLDIRARAELRQPQLFDARTRGTLRSEFLVYPFLLPARNSAEVPDVVVGYTELRESIGVDRAFGDSKHLQLSAFYNFQFSSPFSYLGPLDEGIRSVLVSYISLVQAVDLRDNPLKPRVGMYLANEFQLAGSPTDWLFGSDARDIKIQPEARFYAPVNKHLTIATRGSLGFLFPRSYGDTLKQEAPDRTVDQIAAFNFEADRNRDLQLLFFRAFFSGGPTSNRGYPLRGVGPRGIAPFRLGGSTALRDCVGRAPGGTGVPGAATLVAKLPQVDPAVCSVSLGGLSLWEWSGELRFFLTERFGVLLFLDASDVTRERLTVRLDYPHLSTGAGLRVDTPVGPVRLDMGYAIPGLQRIGGDLDPSTEGQPATFLGLPVALNIAVGEAF